MKDESESPPATEHDSHSQPAKTALHPFFPCPTCGAMYDSAERAELCAAVAPEPEQIPRGTIVEVSEAHAAATGPGYVRKSFLLGLDDPRGPVHARIYRASFIWGSADFRLGELTVRGPATEAEWSAEIENHSTGSGSDWVDPER
jgi:hypothetical protein